MVQQFKCEATSARNGDKAISPWIFNTYKGNLNLVQKSWTLPLTTKTSILGGNYKINSKYIKCLLILTILGFKNRGMKLLINESLKE